MSDFDLRDVAARLNLSSLSDVGAELEANPANVSSGSDSSALNVEDALMATLSDVSNLTDPEDRINSLEQPEAKASVSPSTATLRRELMTAKQELAAAEAKRSLAVMRAREDARREFESEARIAAEAARAEYKARVAALDARAKSLKQRERLLDAKDPSAEIKRSLESLVVSEGLYIKYKGVPAAQRSVRQHVCVRVYEMLRSARREGEALSGQADALRERSAKLESERDSLARECETLSAAVAAANREHKAAVAVGKSEAQALNEQVNVLRAAVADMKSKVSQYDAVAARVASAEASARKLEQENLVLKVASEGAQSDAREGKHRAAELDQQVELLRQDKMYLEKEVGLLKQSLADSKLSKSQLQQALEQVKRQREQLVDKLVAVRDEHKAAFDAKLSSELARIEKKADAELDGLRLTQRDAYEREVSGLRRDAARTDAELDRLRVALQTAQKDLQTVRDANASLSASFARSEQELRAELKIKSFECERLGAAQEKTTKELRKIKLTAEMQDEKNEVLKTEFYNLKAAAGRREAKLCADLESASSRLSAYQQLEADIDAAVITSGDEKAAQDGARGVLSAISTGLPTSAQRRMRQALQLAQKLMEKQREAQALVEETRALKAALVDQEAKNATLRKQLKMVSQPHSYLVETIRAKDEEVKDAQNDAQRLRVQVAELEKEVIASRRAAETTRADLRTVLCKGADFSKLQSMIAGLRARAGRKPRALPKPEQRMYAALEAVGQRGRESDKENPPPVVHPAWADRLKSRLRS